LLESSSIIRWNSSPAKHSGFCTTPLAEELNLEVYKEAIKAGAHVFVDQRMPGRGTLQVRLRRTIDYLSPIPGLL
jgi:hypothetical protein